MATQQLPKEMIATTAFEEIIWETVERWIYRKDCYYENNIEKCELRPLKDFNFKLLEMWYFKDPDTDEVEYAVEPQDLNNQTLLEYLTNVTDDTPVADDKEFLGGLRLLIQKWPRKWNPPSETTPNSPSNSSGHLASETPLHQPVRQDVSASDNTSITSRSFVSWLTKERAEFKGKEPVVESGILPFNLFTLKLMTRKFHLPKCYAMDLLGEIAVPMRLHWINRSSEKEDDVASQMSASSTASQKISLEQNLGIIVQSPKYDDERGFVSTALSYNPITNITSGFFGYVGEKDTEGSPVDGPADGILKILSTESFAPGATHPMLLPTLILHSWLSFVTKRLELARQDLNSVQTKTREMEDAFAEDVKSLAQGRKPAQERYEIKAWYRDNNKKLVDNHKILLEEGFAFIAALGDCSLDSLSVPKEMWTKIGIKRDTIDERELESFCRYLKMAVTSFDQRRERLLKRIDVAFNELFNITQLLLQQHDVAISTSLALAADRDNTVMMGIALLSAIFLPATSIATIFGMVEFFTVDGDTFIVSPTWTLYWKWTAPITGAMLVFWFWWSFWGRVKCKCPPSRQKESEKEQKGSERDRGGDNGGGGGGGGGGSGGGGYDDGFEDQQMVNRKGSGDVEKGLGIAIQREIVGPGRRGLGGVW